MLQKLQNLNNHVDLQAWAIFLSLFIVGFGSWFWFISKRTGRPLRDLFALFAAAIILVTLLMSTFALEDKYLGQGRHRALEYGVFVAASLLITWIFNKFATERSKKLSRHQGQLHKSDPLE